MKSALLAVLLAAVVIVSAQASDQAHIVTPKQQDFMPFPNIPECFQGIVAHGDPEQGPSVLMVKAAGRCAIPQHWHTPNEEVLMVSGTAEVRMKGETAPNRLTSGSYAYIPAKHVHAFRCPGACSFFVVTDGVFDIHYVDAQGTEIPAEKVLKSKMQHAPGEVNLKKKPPEKQ